MTDAENFLTDTVIVFLKIGIDKSAEYYD